MKLTLPILTIAVTIFAGGAFAFDPDDLQKLNDTGDCMWCDLREVNLEGTTTIAANLQGANLEGANLSRTYLKGANLEGANLTNAILHGANLEGANLNYAYMGGAILCNTTMPDGSVIYSDC